MKSRSQYALALWCLAVLWNESTAQEAPCPSDGSVSGYASISAINNFMDAEFDRIAGGGAPEDEYKIRLCPQQVFDASVEPLRPVLSGVVFECGLSGLSADSCTFQGGSEQVVIEDSSLATYPLSQVTFQGVTFQSFTGTSIDVSAGATTSIAFEDVVWTAFDSENVIRQQAPSVVSIEGAKVTGGEATVVFTSDGGTVTVSDLTVDDVTADALISLENGGQGTLAQSTIENSSFTSVTTASSGGVQEVSDTTVSNMRKLEDAFFASGNDSTVRLIRSTIEFNALSNRWRVMNVRNGAQGSSLETTVAENGGLQFAFTASSAATSLTIEDTFFVQNSGRGASETSAVVIGLQGANVSIDNTVFNTNVGFTSQVLGFFSAEVSISNTCFSDTESSFVVFMDNSSTATTTANFVANDVQSRFCDAPGNRLFKEDSGSSCFQGGTCEGECQVLATARSCQINVPPRPTDSPGITSAPTRVPTSSPTESPVATGVPTTTPGTTLAPSTIAPTPALTPEESLPTTSPITSAPTEICPGAKLVKQRKHKPKKKLSLYGRSGSPKKKKKDVHPTYWHRPDQWSFFEVTHNYIDSDTDDDSEYYYFYVCPPSKGSKSAKSSKSSSSSMSKGKSIKASSLYMGKMNKWKSNKNGEKEGMGMKRRVLVENINEAPKPGVRRQRI